MWDIAPKYQAMLLFVEHRYYGNSLPFGKDSYKDVTHLQYLTSEQALADFATLVTELKVWLYILLYHVTPNTNVIISKLHIFLGIYFQYQQSCYCVWGILWR